MKWIGLTGACLVLLAFMGTPAVPQTPKAAPPIAGSVGSSIKGLLGKASDSALEKLAKPGSFSADAAIRIGLPGGKTARDLMQIANRAGVGGNIETALNDAATAAAGAAKPIFRTAIDRMTLTDAASMAKGSTGATDYLRKSAGDQVRAQLEPLVQAALKKSGALSQISKLSAFGITETSLVQHVAQKASDGIFLYMGKEEAALRKNPLAILGR